MTIVMYVCQSCKYNVNRKSNPDRYGYYKPTEPQCKGCGPKFKHFKPRRNE